MPAPARRRQAFSEKAPEARTTRTSLLARRVPDVRQGRLDPVPRDAERAGQVPGREQVVTQPAAASSALDRNGFATTATGLPYCQPLPRSSLACLGAFGSRGADS